MFIRSVTLAVEATCRVLTADASSLSFMSSTNNGFSAGSAGTSSSLLPINRIVTPCQEQYSFKGTYFNWCLKPPIMIFSNTGWRKNNACFSNNCNFVYFQYKKIMSTPKQPVINAVLITYINYSITENYIGKMAPFLPYIRPEPLLKLLHHIY